MNPHTLKRALAPQASVSAVPPLRRVARNATQVILPEPFCVVKGQFSLFCNRPVGVDDHKDDKRKHEDDRERDGDAVEVLLDDARTGLGGVHRAGDHVGDARALAGMQQDEHDEADARNDEQDERDDEERIQGSSLFFRSKVYRYASC